MDRKIWKLSGNQSACSKWTAESSTECKILLQDSQLNSVVVMQIRSFFLQEWAVLQRITRSKPLDRLQIFLTSHRDDA